MTNTYTTNYNLAKPAHGDVDWHIPINENWDKIDTTMKDIAIRCPTGSIIMYGAATAPTGWLECDGSAVSRTTYADLFAVIGTTFGEGDGSTTFNLPDLRGEFVRGWDHGRGADVGRELGTAQGDEFRTHSHRVEIGYYVHGGGRPLSGYRAVDRSVDEQYPTTPVGGPETRPRNVALMYIIKT